MFLFGNNLRLSGHDMFLFVDDLRLSGHAMFLFGNNLLLSGHDMFLFGNGLRLSGHDFFLFGNNFVCQDMTYFCLEITRVCQDMASHTLSASRPTIIQKYYKRCLRVVIKSKVITNHTWLLFGQTVLARCGNPHVSNVHYTELRCSLRRQPRVRCRWRRR